MIRAFPEDPPPPRSNTGERGWHEKTSGGGPSGSGDPEGADSGVGTLFGDGLPSLASALGASLVFYYSQAKSKKGKP
jgi:hypothetical protein